MTLTGALVMGFFATVWWIVGLRSAGYGPALVFLVPIAIALLLLVTARRHSRSRAADGTSRDSAEEARRDRVVAWASAAEGLALFVVAGVVLPSTGHRDFTAPAVALIVGLHFIPLARGLPARAYYGTAAALVGLGLAGLAISDVPARTTVVSAGAAAVLWLTAFSVLRGSVGVSASHRLEG